MNLEKVDPHEALCCSICSALRERRALAPYWSGEEERFACEDDRCRELARVEMRTGRAVARRAA